MAMVFFILALALVLVGLSAKEKSGLCEARAESLVQNVRSQVVGVVSAPIEDERKVIPLERVLSTGSEDFQRYNLTVTWRKTQDSGGIKQTLILEAKAVSASCSSGSSLLIPYGSSSSPSSSGYRVHFIGSNKNRRQTSPSAISVDMTVEPSKKYGETTPPSYYLVVLKCSTKAWPFEKHLYVEDCTRENPADCVNFDSTEIDNCCGWGHKVDVGGVQVVQPLCSNALS